MSPARLLPALAAAILTLGSATLSAQAPLSASPARARGDYSNASSASSARPNAAFRISGPAVDSLRALWALSIAERREEVACLAGHVESAQVTIDRVRILRQAVADTFTINAQESIDTCGAPEWLGTVHTHIARLNGQPYITFSGADRGVMMIWRNRWQAPGVFCLLYDATRGWCEAGNTLDGDIELPTMDGASGATVTSGQQ
jgi:hypothetical protein